MSILAFDTSLAACSAAVWCDSGDGTSLHHAWEARERGHAEALLPMILQVMEEAELGFEQLDRLAVTTGPGSFSGVRIGIATARGLALASGLPLVGVNTLELMAANVIARGQYGQVDCLAIAHDARRSEIYLGLFDSRKRPLSEAMLVGIEEALDMLPHHNVLVAGSGGPLLAEAARDVGRELDTTLPDLLPDASELVQLAQNRKPTGEPVRPLYLRAPDAKPQRAQTLARQP